MTIGTEPLHSARRSVEIDVPAEFFYEVLTDFASYPDFLSEVVSIDARKTGDERWVTRFVARVLRQFEYTLEIVGTPYEKLDWTLEEPGFFLDNRGGWRLESLTDTSIRATFHLDIRVSAFVPKAMTNRLAATSLPQVLGEWKERAEHLYIRALQGVSPDPGKNQDKAKMGDGS